MLESHQGADSAPLRDLLRPSDAWLAVSHADDMGAGSFGDVTRRPADPASDVHDGLTGADAKSVDHQVVQTAACLREVRGVQPVAQVPVISKQGRVQAGQRVVVVLRTEFSSTPP